MTSMRRALVVPLLALVGPAYAVPPSASAFELDCGAIITEDTELTADVVCAEGEASPHGYALLIAADGVTLDLNGHRVGNDWIEGIDADGRNSHHRPGDGA